MESSITNSQSSSHNYRTTYDTPLESIDDDRANDDASTRPIKGNAPPTLPGPDLPSEYGVASFRPSLPLIIAGRSLELLKKIYQTLKDSTIAQESGTDGTSRFWAMYKRHAEEYDSEFFEKYKDDMDIVLIFAGLFSAVSTSFLTAMQSSLSTDPTGITNALLMQVVHALNSTAFAGQDLEPPTWNGPGSTMI
ncbi:hypothetical protein BV22DRAFT_1172953 [Leucogyrophana mollusca]|uniref:Uncharacterized protein n=1 Tax=Leucogyrophana mollusca TaxID=85980 RepID=A0ACB8BAZ3_9AGAM|nr:hypothetical protein BV22DRAFT_1172953 [Leucogyrophana mollusca]